MDGDCVRRWGASTMLCEIKISSRRGALTSNVRPQLAPCLETGLWDRISAAEKRLGNILDRLSPHRENEQEKKTKGAHHRTARLTAWLSEWHGPTPSIVLERDLGAMSTLACAPSR